MGRCERRGSACDSRAARWASDMEEGREELRVCVRVCVCVCRCVCAAAAPVPSRRNA